MFAKSQASANFDNLAETAKANHLYPYEYLKLAFTQLPNMTTKENLDGLAPWNVPPH